MAEMPQFYKDILDDVSYFSDRYFTFDEPIPFCGLFLYPIPAKYYNEFLSCSQCLTINIFDNAKTFKAGPIGSLVEKMQDEREGIIWSMRFTKLLELALHVKSCLKCDKCGKEMSFEEYSEKFNNKEIADKSSILICDCGGSFQETVKYKKVNNKYFLYIDGHELDRNNFNKLRKYIMYQNIPDFKDDEWVDKSIREDQAAKAEILSKNQGKASLERKIIGLSMNSNYSIEEIKNMSIRKFLISLNMIDEMINYTSMKSGLMSGMVSLKKGAKIEHWLYKNDEGMYGAAMDANAYTSQIK